MPYNFRKSDIPKLDLETDRNNFTSWIEEWTAYAALSGLNEENAITQYNILRLALSREAAKEMLSEVPTLAFYDATRPTRIMTDACNTGLGFVLQQKNGDTWHTIQIGSRFLSDTETCYATIEKEMLGVTWSITKCHKFLAGLPHFEVVTDHNPLLAILNNRQMDEIENPILQRMRTKLMSYHFTE